MSQIVVGVSGSQGGWQALSWAVSEAAATGRALVIAHACRADVAVERLAGIAAARNGGLATISSRRALEALTLQLPAVARGVAAAQLRLGGHRVQLVVRPEPAGELLVGIADRSDLVVVGPPVRPGWLERASTASYVVHHALGPVVVARGDSGVRGGDGRGGDGRGPFRGNVVVGVDGSASARPALAFGFGFAAEHRLPLVALHVTERGSTDVWYDDHLLETHLVGEPAALELLAAEVEPWQHRYPGVAVKRAIFAGPPLSGLLRGADGAALLVVGDRGLGPVRRALLGSVSQGAIERAGEPVAVVRADSEGPFSPHDGT
jgi:nucleotide-binding universal stress UspA family protein